MLATISEASMQLGISRQTLDKWRKAGKVASVQQDGRTFIALPDPEPSGDLRTFIALPDPEPSGDLRSILENVAELPAARAAVADAEAVLAGMLDRLNECRRLLQPMRHVADNAKVHQTGGFDALAGEVDQLTISLAAQRAKVLRCRLKVAELVRDAVTPAVAPARGRYDSLRASLAEAGAILGNLQSTAENARRDASDLAYQLKSIHLA